MADENAVKLAWVTGAGTGIGRALAAALASKGWRVFVSGRSPGPLEQLAAEAGRRGHNIVPYPLDITDPPAVETTVQDIENKYGPLSLAVLNAGTHKPMTAEDYNIDTAANLMAVNYMGTVHCLAPVLARFRARRSGQIAIVSSLAGYRGLPLASAYGPSKAALINLAESLKPDCDRDGVALSLVNPGFVKTPLTDKNTFSMPFLIDADRAAEIIVQGLQAGKFEITFPWPFAWIMKLMRILPYWAYFPLIKRQTGT